MYVFRNSHTTALCHNNKRSEKDLGGSAVSVLMYITDVDLSQG